MTEVEADSESRQISLRRRSWLCAAAWIVAIVVVVVEFGWQSLLYFPLVTPTAVAVMFIRPAGSDGANLAVATTFGWLYYMLLTFWSLCTNRRSVFVRVFTVLCISILLNLGGCEYMKHAHWST
jgi:hypothetical protein